METQNEVKYVGFWIRWVAFTIDCLIVSILSVIIQIGLGILFGIIGINKVATLFLSLFISPLIFVSYFIFMTYKYQATLGKMIVGIKIFSDKGFALTIGQITLRETIGRFLSTIIFFIGYIMVGFTDKKQALHDKIADTVVVYKDLNKKTPKWPIVVAILIIIGPLFLGIFSGAILGFLNVQSRVEKKEMDIRRTLTAIAVEASFYASKNSSYLGFQSKVSPLACSGKPIINISKDGKQIAIFIKSCVDGTKYFCANPVKVLVEDIANTNEGYVKSGAVICESETLKENKNVINMITIKETNTELPTTREKTQP